MKVPYHSIRDELSTMDLVLFRGLGMVSNLISLSGPYTHVGMVIRTPKTDVSPDTVMLWESTKLSNVRDLISGRFRRGVQTVFLSDRLRSYEGRVFILPIMGPRTEECMVRLHEFRKSMVGVPYEKKIITLIKAVFGDELPGEADLTSVFCSELVMSALAAMGWSEDTDPDRWTPSEIANRLPLIYPYTTGSLVEIDLEPKVEIIP